MKIGRPLSHFLASTLGVGAALVVSLPAGVEASGFSCSGSQGPVYHVAQGDSWYGIAGRVDVAPADLLGANDASVDDVLVEGDRLCLPAGAKTLNSCPSGRTTYTVSLGDSWFGIAQRADVTLATLLGSNGASADRNLHPDDKLCLPAGASAISGGGASSSSNGKSGSTMSYAVVSGDSWFGIADRADVSLRQLLQANGANSASVLMAGDTISLPAGATKPRSGPAASGAVRLESAPVRGACWFSDTWSAPRAGGRLHRGTDILASTGHYVRAVVDGKLTRRAWDQPSKRGGNAWTLTGADGTYFYYGHLGDFAPGLQVGSWVKAGDIIGFVGSTGNTTTPHVHFEIHPRGGSAVNPYGTLRAAGECGRALG